eukprot:s451_g9.t1
MFLILSVISALLLFVLPRVIGPNGRIFIWAVSHFKPTRGSGCIWDEARSLQERHCHSNRYPMPWRSFHRNTKANGGSLDSSHIEGFRLNEVMNEWYYSNVDPADATQEVRNGGARLPAFSLRLRSPTTLEMGDEIQIISPSDFYLLDTLGKCRGFRWIDPTADVPVATFTPLPNSMVVCNASSITMYIMEPAPVERDYYIETPPLTDNFWQCTVVSASVDQNGQRIIKASKAFQSWDIVPQLENLQVRLLGPNTAAETLSSISVEFTPVTTAEDIAIVFNSPAEFDFTNARTEDDEDQVIFLVEGPLIRIRMAITRGVRTQIILRSRGSETLAVLETDEFLGKSVKTVKQSLASRVGFSRFRQRFLSEDGSRRIADEESFASTPVKIQLVIVGLGLPNAEQEERIIAAARDNNSGVLEELLQRPLDPNVTDADGNTPLHHAARNGHLQPVKLLLVAGAPKDAAQRADQRTPLLLATLNDHIHIVHLLVEASAEKEKADVNGLTPLGIAAERGNLDIARLLIEAGADKENVSKNGLTALGMAVVSGRLRMARFLIEAGADKENVSKNGLTALGMAVVSGRLHMARFLIEAGADKEKAPKNRLTPLGIAAEKGNLDMARFLIEAGADKEKAPKNGLTPLGIAAEKGNLYMVRLLIEAGADKEKAKQDGQTPLAFAVARGSLSVARLLVEAGADKEKANVDGQTPLLMASAKGDLDIVQMLILAGADTEKARKDGFTPLLVASAFGKLEVVRCLIATGADREKSQQDGITALGMAAALGHLDIVRLLLEAGADTKHAANDGQRPLEIAAGEGHLDIVRLLVENGAQCPHTDTVASALDVAYQRGHLEVACFLADLRANMA